MVPCVFERGNGEKDRMTAVGMFLLLRECGDQVSEEESDSGGALYRGCAG